jgi:lysophospholipase L1-like esterase
MSEKTFADGARVAMVGDSITRSGLAVAYIQEYYLSHFPERRVKIYNLGTPGAIAREATQDAFMADILAVEPTEAVVMFGVNDMDVTAYASPTPPPEIVERRMATRRRHLEATVRLVGMLRERGLSVTLCSAVGRDEHTAKEGGFLTYGATDALHAMYRDNLAAIGEGVLKNTVDYLSPMQALQAALCATHGPSLFAPDRTHPSELGQVMMARILLRSQGLPVTLPSAEALVAGWRERVLPRALRERRSVGLRWRDLSWVYPHQADRTKGMDLSARIEFWGQEALRKDLPPYFINMYRNYAENAQNEAAYFAEYLAKTDALYEEENEVIVKEGLRI